MRSIGVHSGLPNRDTAAANPLHDNADVVQSLDRPVPSNSNGRARRSGPDRAGELDVVSLSLAEEAQPSPAIPAQLRTTLTGC